MSALSGAAFAWLARFLKARSGLALGADKQYLLESRLAPIVRREGCADLAALVARLGTLPDGPLADEVVAAMTTNETYFFRDGTPFAHLARGLPGLHAARPPGQPIRIWSAACSTGQEAYSIAMLVADARAILAGRPVEILGTDISAGVLARAEAGLYSRFEVQRGLPVTRLVRHFRKDGAEWRISAALRAMVRWQVCNLLQPPAGLGRFDVVFCRNVLLYFDPPTRARVLERIAALMAPDGVLYLGGAETLRGISARFVPLSGERGAYTPAPSASQPPTTPGAAATGTPGPRGASGLAPATGFSAGRTAGAYAAVGSRST